MQADAVLHFGTHGSLEFMPGKQVGMSDLCYPDSLIGTIPNIYYYAANNPSEATIAKRRSYANTISYLTPPAENAGLYKGLKVGFAGCLVTQVGLRFRVSPAENAGLYKGLKVGLAACVVSQLESLKLTDVNCVVALRSVLPIELSLHVVDCTSFIILFVGRQNSQMFQPVLDACHSS